MFQASGGSVPLALGIWALPAAAAALAWLPQWRFRTAPAGARPPGQRRLLKVSRYLLAWQVMGFMGLQSLIYYATLSWLPTLFRDRGADPVHAGTLLALMNLGNAVTLLLVPLLAHRTRDQRWLVALTVACAAVGLAGAWFAPLGGAVAWVLLLGFGQGAALGLAVYFTVARAPDPVSVRVPVGVHPGSGLSGGHDRPAGGRLPAHRDRELDHPGRGAARRPGRRARRGLARRAAGRPPEPPEASG